MTDSAISLGPERVPPAKIPARPVRVSEKGAVFKKPKPSQATSSRSAIDAVWALGRWPTESTTRSKRSSWISPLADVQRMATSSLPGVGAMEWTRPRSKRTPWVDSVCWP